MLALLTPAISTEGATSIIASVNWGAPTWDLFIILFFLVAAFLYGISLGRDRILVIMVSIYMALAVVNAAPESIVIKNLATIRVSAFIGIFLLLFFLLSRSALIRSIATGDSKGPWWQVMLFSVLHVGLLISVVLSLLPESSIAKLAPTTQRFFVQDPAPFLWVLAPIVLMVLIRGSSDEKKFKYDL